MAVYRPCYRNCSHVLILLICVFRVTCRSIDSSKFQARDDCGSDPAWKPSVDAWQQAKTDKNFAQWWQSTSAANTSSNLANALASQFGDHITGFSCGINSQGTCALPGCQPYVDSGDEPWTYQALAAVVNLNTFFDRLYDGITDGQADYEGLASDIAQTFFPWQDPKFGANDAAVWIGATVGALFTFIAPESRLVAAGARAIAAFVDGGAQEAQIQLTPDSGLTLNQGIALISEAASQAAQQSRNSIESWASVLFSGGQDEANNTILDYSKGGGFVAGDLPSNTMFENFWKMSLIARTINSQWTTDKNFVTFARTADQDISVGPEISRYYSNETGGVYYLYQWNKKKLQMPKEMMSLQHPEYNIQPSDVTASSARAFEVAGFNYTPSVALDRIKSSIFNNTFAPLTEGSRWEGLWTLPVCDMGDNVQWNGLYGESNMAPCCCGPDCRDTKTFVELANLKGVNSYRNQCSKQLKGTSINFTNIDYGF